MSSEALFQAILVPVDFFPAADAADEDDDGTAGKDAGRPTILTVGDARIEVSPASEHALELATRLARRDGAKLEILHVTPELERSRMYTGPLSVPSQLLGDLSDRARQEGLAVLTALHGRHCEDLRAELVVRTGDPHDVIVREATDRGVDLIVLATSGRSRISRFFLGSTTDRVIREAPCPVLVVPAYQ